MFDMAHPENGRKSCRLCGQKFKPYRAWQVFCSPQCRHRAYNKKAPVWRGGLQGLIRRVVREELALALEQRKR